MKWRLVLMLAVVGAALAPGSAAQAQAGSWVTAWQAAPHSAGGGGLLGVDEFRAGFTDRSVRTVVTPHATGSQVRVRLSNVFGRRPVTFAAVSVAERAAGPALAPGTARALTFAGRPSVTVPAGAEVVSDPVAFAARPFVDLAVTTAFAAPTGMPTVHQDGLQTSYVSRRGSGDLTADETGAAFGSRTLARFFVARVETLAPPGARTVVAVGDSITDGAGRLGHGPVDLAARWPDFLQRRLLAAGSTLTVANAGISSNRIRQGTVGPLTSLGPSLIARFDRDVLAHPNLGAILLLEGTNDIGSYASARQVTGAMRAIAARAHAAGVPIAVGTLPPLGDSQYDIISPGPFGVEYRRRSVNAWIRTQRDFDAVIDFDAALRDPARPSRMRREYDCGDHLHPSPAGYAAMAAAIDLDVLARLAAPATADAR